MRKRLEKRNRARLLGLTLSAALVFSGLPTANFQIAEAADGDAMEVSVDEAGTSKQDGEADAVTASGTFGGEKDSTGAELTPDTHQWTFSAQSGTLTISGEGAMPTYTTSTYSSVPWYSYMDSIKKIVFKGKVTTVGAYAFYKYDKVEEVDFGGAEELTEICEGAFRNAANISKLTGTEHLVTLGKQSFASVKGLQSVSMPNVEAIPEQAFEFHNLTSIDFPNATLVGRRAFYYGTTAPMTDVKLPKVEEIAGDAFRACQSMESIELPELQTITAGYNFYQCSALKRVSFPKLTSVSGQAVFQECLSLEVLDLPELTTMTNAHQFANQCRSLLWANLPKANAAWNQCNGMFYRCSSLVYVDISGLNSLNPQQARFSECRNLKRVYIKGDALTTDADSRFAFDSTPTIYVGDEATKTRLAAYTAGSVEVAADFEAVKKKETTLLLSQEDYDIESPAAPKVVGNAAGAELSYRYYTDIACSQAVNTNDPTQRPTAPGEYYVRATAGAVGDAYFETTSNPAKFMVYGEIAGEGYTYHNGSHVLTITNASVMDTDYTSASNTPWKDYYGEVEKVVVKEGVTLTKIADYAFASMNKMTTFELPDTVTSIGASAFRSCSAWEAENVLTTKVTSIGQYAFYSCKKLSGTMTINEGITEIPAYMLNGCEGVTKIQYTADKVTSFGERCFTNTGVTELSLPENITEIPPYFFSGCKNITSVAIPASVTAFGERCFAECVNLKEIVVPDGITSLGAYCFSGTGISSITLPETLSDIGDGVLNRTPNLETVEILVNMTSIPNSMFAYSGLKTFVVPATVTQIGETAFRGSELKKIIVPSTVTQIGKDAFRSCGQMEYLEFENDEYNDATFAGSPVSGPSGSFDSTFAGVSQTAMVVCDGATYELLASRGTYKSDALNGWLAEEILYKRSEFLAKLEADYAAVREEAGKLTEADYDKELWAAFQTALTEADALFAQGETVYDKVTNRMAAAKSIPAAAKPFLRATYQKTLDIVEMDYDTEGDGADAWFDYLDQRDSALALLQNEDATLTEIIESEKQLRRALDQIVLLPVDGPKAEVDQAIQAAGALKEADYTPESWAALQTAIKEAQEICKDAMKVSQVAVAKKKIDDAMAALVKVDVADPGTKPSAAPSTQPSVSPSAQPSVKPSVSPSAQPSAKPSVSPSAQPSAKPTEDPGIQPTKNPDGSQVNKDPGGTAKSQKVTVKKVTLKKVKSTKKKSITVQWKKLAGVTGYQVQIGTNKKVTKGKKTYTVKKAKTVKKTIKKLKRKKKYYVRVRAYKTVKGKKYYGKWSKVKNVKVK